MGELFSSYLHGLLSGGKEVSGAHGEGLLFAEVKFLGVKVDNLRRFCKYEEGAVIYDLQRKEKNGWPFA